MQLKRKKPPSDDRPADFSRRFNDELLPSAKDFSWAVAVRVSGAGWLDLYPGQSVAAALVRTEEWLRKGPPVRRRIANDPERESEVIAFPGDDPGATSEV